MADRLIHIREGLRPGTTLFTSNRLAWMGVLSPEVNGQLHRLGYENTPLSPEHMEVLSAFGPRSTETSTNTDSPCPPEPDIFWATEVTPPLKDADLEVLGDFIREKGLVPTGEFAGYVIDARGSEESVVTKL